MLILLLLISCATSPTVFYPHKVCSPGALQVYYDSILKGNRASIPKEVKELLRDVRPQINQCYISYTASAGVKEFETCLIVIYDESGKLSYQKMSSQDLDEKIFFNCARGTLKNLANLKIKNTSVLQSYNFYSD